MVKSLSMKNNLDNKTFIFISLNKFKIVVLDNLNKIIYEKISIVNNQDNYLNLNFLDEFLSQNVFEIEKLLKEYIENVFLIIDLNDIFQVHLSIKKNTDNTDSNYINNLLTEAKNLCEKTLKHTNILHIKIDQFCIDNINYKILPNIKDHKNFSIDLSFICLPVHIYKDLEKIFIKYRISISNSLSLKYLDSFENKKNNNIYNIALKVLDGLNENEVIILKKNPKNIGFFEKFFNFFN